MLDKPRNFKIEGVELNWARLDTPVNPFGQEQYELQIATTDKDKAQKLRDNYFNVKEKDGKFVVNLKRRAKKVDGSDNGKVRVVDSNLAPMENTRSLGNGSVGNVICWQYPYEAMGRKGVAGSLTAVQVTSLVEYKSDNTTDFSVVDAAVEPEVSAEELF